MRANHCMTLFTSPLPLVWLGLLSTIFLSGSAVVLSVASQTPAEGEDDTSTGLPKGHLQPLGSHRPPEGKIKEVNGFLDPIEFYTNHVLASEPVLFKRAAHEVPAYSLWSDTYLKEKFGSVMVDVEQVKKENRDNALQRIPFEKFLDVYNESNIYMVQDVLPQMLDDLILPKSIQCGGFQNALTVGVMWFSSGGTKSVLHTDDVDNINCLFDGDKDIVFISHEYSPFVEHVHYVKQRSYSTVDVDKVDLEKFPLFAKLKWWKGRMEKGDCLFIPVGWYHSVVSSDSRNLAVNLWFSHLAWFNKSDCENCCHSNPSLSSYKIGESLEQTRHYIFSVFEGLDFIPIEEAVERWGDILSDPALVQEVFEFIDQDKDLLLTWEEVFEVDIASLIQEYPEFVGGHPPPHDEL